MTKEEAISFGNMWLELNEDAEDSASYQFFKMAISALSFLEREKKTVAERTKQNLSELAQYNADMLKAFNAGKELAEREKREWIPVSSGELPKIGQEVLATVEFCEGGLKVVKILYDKYGFCHGKTTAWMPAPEPYKENDTWI